MLVWKVCKICILDPIAYHRVEFTVVYWNRVSDVSSRCNKSSKKRRDTFGDFVEVRKRSLKNRKNFYFKIEYRGSILEINKFCTEDVIRLSTSLKGWWSEYKRLWLKSPAYVIQPTRTLSLVYVRKMKQYVRKMSVSACRTMVKHRYSHTLWLQRLAVCTKATLPIGLWHVSESVSDQTGLEWATQSDLPADRGYQSWLNCRERYCSYNTVELGNWNFQA